MMVGSVMLNNILDLPFLGYNFVSLIMHSNMHGAFLCKLETASQQNSVSETHTWGKAEIH